MKLEYDRLRIENQNLREKLMVKEGTESLDLTLTQPAEKDSTDSRKTAADVEDLQRQVASLKAERDNFLKLVRNKTDFS